MMIRNLFLILLAAVLVWSCGNQQTTNQEQVIEEEVVVEDAPVALTLDEFKEKIIALLKNGSSKKFVADRYVTSQVNLYNWLKKNDLNVKSQKVCV